jgi:hypothetical protein
VYRFGRDWSNPQLLFPLLPGGFYHGIGYSAASGYFWLTKKVPTGTVIEQWSREGKHLSSPINIPSAFLSGIAVDPKDETLWAVAPQASGVRLENFDPSGRRLGSFDLERPLVNYLDIQASGAEFEWIAPQ